MKIRVRIDDDQLSRARELTGVSDPSALAAMGLDVLIARESARRLAALGGTEKELKPIPRRRSAKRRGQ